MRTRLSSLAPLSLLSIGLVACDSPPPPSEVRARIAEDLGHVLRQTAAAQAGAAAELPGTSLVDRLAPSSTSSLRVVRDLAARFVPRSATPSRSGVAPEDPAPAPTIDADAIVAQLNQTMFTDANHVGDGIYQVPVALACERTSFDDLGNPTTSIDPDCASSWDQLGLRIQVRDDGDGLVFGIQLGAAHDEPLAIGLHHDALSITIDLDETEAAIEALAIALGETAPNAALAGRITAALTVLGPARIGAALTIDRALAIAVADAGAALDGPDAFRMGSEAGTVLDLELDGNTAAGSLELGLGATTLHVPGADGFALDLPGATMTALLAAGQPLQLSNLSLGDRTTTLTRGGVVALALDLNADAGRTLDATLSADPQTGLDTLTVTPKFDLRLAIDHSGETTPAPVYDVTRILLDGSLRSGGAQDQLEVATGTFAITTNPAGYGVTATAGQCVSSTETYDAGLDAFYTAWSAGACL